MLREGSIMSKELERFAAFYRRQMRSVFLSGVDVRRIWLQIRSRLQEWNGAGDSERKGS